MRAAQRLLGAGTALVLAVTSLLLLGPAAQGHPVDPCAGLTGYTVVAGQFCTHGDDAQLADSGTWPLPRASLSTSSGTTEESSSCVYEGAVQVWCPADDPEQGSQDTRSDSATSAGDCLLEEPVQILCTPEDDPVQGPPPAPSCGDSGRRIHAIYLRESHQADQFASFGSRIEQAMADADAILLQSAQREGRSAHFRFAANQECRPKIANVVTSRPQHSFHDAIDAVQDAGYRGRSDRTWLIFSDNTNGCGAATLSSDSQPDPSRNENNLTEHYVNVSRNCINGHVVAHELGHVLGAVQPGAPHASGGGHCSDGYDVLCDGSSGSSHACERPILFDCNRDDYFAFVPQSEYLRTHWNTVNSYWITVG